MVEYKEQVYNIAGISVYVNAFGETLIKRGLKYLSDCEPPYDIVIDVPISFIEKKQKENPHLSLSDCEYIWTGSKFYRTLLDFDAFMLHASAVVYNDTAYLFSAPCGTGKSTHTSLWQEYFGKENAYILNDDKPAILYRDGGFYAAGTPWSGKTDQNENRTAALGAITFLSRSGKNYIEKINGAEALALILNQTLRPSDSENMDKLLTLLDKLSERVPLFKAGVDMSEDAVRTTFNAMSRAIGLE
jgi:hypothetical protein